MTAEGALGLAAGIMAGSVALTGWALSSTVEGLASVIVVWRFTGSRTHSPTAERQAQRAVAISLWLLAPYVAAESLRDLLTGHRPQAAALGLAVTAASLVVMPLLGRAKHRRPPRLGGNRGRRFAEPAVRLPGRSRAHRLGRQHPVRRMVA